MWALSTYLDIWRNMFSESDQTQTNFQHIDACVCNIDALKQRVDVRILRIMDLSPLHSSIFLTAFPVKDNEGAGANPSCHSVRGGGQPGKVASLSQSWYIEADKSHMENLESPMNLTLWTVGECGSTKERNNTQAQRHYANSSQKGVNSCPGSFRCVCKCTGCGFKPSFLSFSRI